MVLIGTALHYEKYQGISQLTSRCRVVPIHLPVVGSCTTLKGTIMEKKPKKTKRIGKASMDVPVEILANILKFSPRLARRRWLTVCKQWNQAINLLEPQRMLHHHNTTNHHKYTQQHTHQMLHIMTNMCAAPPFT